MHVPYLMSDPALPQNLSCDGCESRNSKEILTNILYRTSYAIKCVCIYWVLPITLTSDLLI